LNVVNAVSKEAAPVSFYLSYYTNGGIGEDHETTIDLGNAWGKFEKEVVVPRSSYNHVLKYRSSLSAIPNFYNDEFYSGSYPVSKKVKNEFDVVIDPYYYYIIKTNNINCFDANDTLWLTDSNHNTVDVSEDLIFTGCDGGVFGPIWRTDSLFAFHYVVKKNGVITQHQQTEVISWNTTEILLEY